MSEPICKDCRYFREPHGLAYYLNLRAEPMCEHAEARDVVTGAARWCKTARLLICERGRLFQPRQPVGKRSEQE